MPFPATFPQPFRNARCDTFLKNFSSRLQAGFPRSLAWESALSCGVRSLRPAARSVSEAASSCRTAETCASRTESGWDADASSTPGNGVLELGQDTALSPGVTVDASGGLIRMGRQVAVGPGTVIRAANHRFERLDTPIMLQGHAYGEIIIDDDVWIAANCTITPDVRIGRGAVVGAGAVVTRDVEPYAIVGGVPARVIGRRSNR